MGNRTKKQTLATEKGGRLCAAAAQSISPVVLGVAALCLSLSVLTPDRSVPARLLLFVYDRPACGFLTIALICFFCFHLLINQVHAVSVSVSMAKLLLVLEVRARRGPAATSGSAAGSPGGGGRSSISRPRRRQRSSPTTYPVLKV